MADTETTISTDVGIVGSGVASALLAHGLATAGVKVAMLEAGPKVDRGDAYQRYLESPVKDLASPYPVSADYPQPGGGADPWYVQAGPKPFKSTYLKAVGGTTWHWLGVALRLLPDDLRMRSRFGVAVDWPLTYEELEPWYQRAEEALGVAGDPAYDLGSPRRKPYPLPPIPPSFSDKRVAAALAGTDLVVAPTPAARLSKQVGDRPACCGNASCVPLCPVQAKYDATVHVDLAVKAGCALHPLTTAVALEIGADRRVTAVRFRRPDGSTGRLVAKVFVLGANAMEIPRLLLASRSEAMPNGAANGSDQVGRNLMDHPIQLTWALTREPIWPYRGPMATGGIDKFRQQGGRGRDAAFRLELNNSGWSWPTGAPTTTARALAEKGLRGTALARAFAERGARELTLSALIEQLPDPENRVTLDPDRRDRYGVPHPRIRYSLDDYVTRARARARKMHEDVLRRVGVSELHHGTDFEGAGHIIGTTRMGTDPKRSVVDRTLRSHDHPNLFLLGSSVFPTAGAANPTLTIAALSLRAVVDVRRAVQS